MTGKKVIETIPARNQNCKTNFISSVQPERSQAKKERMAEEVQQQQKMALQYSYNSRVEQEGNRSGQKNRADGNTDSLSMTMVWRHGNHR